MARTDLVDIELNAAGIARAGANGTLSIHGSRKNYSFKPGVSQEVDVAYSWRRWLSRTGLFQIAAKPAADAAAAPATPASTASTAAPAATAAAAQTATRETVAAKPAAAATEKEPHRYTPAEAVAAAEKQEKN